MNAEAGDERYLVCAAGAATLVLTFFFPKSISDAWVLV